MQANVDREKSPSARRAKKDVAADNAILDGLPAFIFLVADDFTIRYANGFFQRQFGLADRSSHCYSLMHGRRTPCECCPVQKVFKEGKQQVRVWKDTIRHQVYRVYDTPFPSPDNGLLVLVMGVCDYRQREMVNKDFLRICCHCKNVHKERENWETIEAFLHGRYDLRFSHGICPECLQRHYPRIMNEKETREPES